MQSVKKEFEQYQKETREFIAQVENLGYQQLASIPAVKKVNGVENPAGITVSELLAMSKMALLNNRALCLGASPNGQELLIVSVLKRPLAPSSLKYQYSVEIDIGGEPGKTYTGLWKEATLD